MEQIKLVIWDLDDTFWTGTLSDGAVTPRPEMTGLVRALAEHGIISSICSKNDMKAARAELEKLGVWEYFVFPSINWNGKGTRVRDIIHAASLRPVNVLFVDDNRSNLEEARFLLPELQTALPEDLLKMRDSEALRGKPDPTLSRLKHYRILETKRLDREQYSSNEAFLYQSDIRVELLPVTERELPRVHEMIHRNNQLNYTKDRISLEAVRELFLDPQTRGGVIHVTDRYGDHGLVGCYAMRENRLRQFVLSCRVLGMGVEQWVYASLGHPDIEVREPVAQQLTKDPPPPWINRSASKQKRDDPAVTGKSLRLYGSCPLRPVWAYLQPQIKNASFSEIDPEPSVCNLAVIVRESNAQRREWLEKISVFDSEFTFDESLLSDQTDYLLISLDSEMRFLRYEKDGHIFFAGRLTEASASPEILREYSVRPITYSDIDSSLRYICGKLSPREQLLIQLVPEVVFPSKGEDQNYQDRKKMNEIALRLAEEFPNVQVIDIRKYAKTPLDFYNTSSSHYNRAIGYQLAKEVLEIVAGVDEGDGEGSRGKHFGEIRDEIRLRAGVVRYTMWISNGSLYMELEADRSDLQFRFACLRNRINAYESAMTSERTVKLRIDRPGNWKIRVCIEADGEECSFETPSIVYDEYHYGLYIDANADDYCAFRSGLQEFVADNVKYRQNADALVRQIAELQACGRNISDYFLERGISKLAVFADEQIANVLLPFLHAGGIQIDRVYTVSDRGVYTCFGGTTIDLVADLQQSELPDTSSDILLAFDGRMKARWLTLFKNFSGEKIDLPYVLSVLQTDEFFCKKVISQGLPRVICVRSPKLHPFHSFPNTSLKPEERNAYRAVGAPANALRMLESGDPLPGTFAGTARSALSETLQLPLFQTDLRTKRTQPADVQGRYCTVSQGERLTVGQSAHASQRLFLFGTSYAYGFGVSNEDTIASQLQSMLGCDWQVHNCANAFFDTDYDSVLRNIFFRTYRPNDIIVVLLTNWQADTAEVRWHWLNWDGCLRGVERVDAFPLFMKSERPSYFRMDGAYTEEGAKALAKLIFEHVGGLE